MAQENVQTMEQSQEQQQPQTAKQADMARRPGADPSGFFMTPVELLRMNPFSLMRRMMEDVFLGNTVARGDAAIAWAPAIEISAQNGRYVVRAELPGLKPEDISVEVNDNLLLIQGERKFDQQEDENGVHRSERRYGRFYRAIPLPDGADVDQAHATFQNGVLEIALPIPMEQKRRREIAIDGNSSNTAGSGGMADQAA